MCTILSHFANFLLVFCLAWPSSCRSWSFNRTITVSLSTGDDSKCNVSSSKTPCRTLDRAFELSANSTLIKIERGNYSLNGSYSFSWIKDFEVKGPDQNSQSVNVSCSGNASLSFVLSENLVFQGLTFSHCGTLRKSTVDKPHKNVLFVTALYFNYCKNVQATAVDFVSSPGVAVTLYAVGSVNFTECVFRDNKPPGHIPINGSRESQVDLDLEHAAIAGGGVYLQLGRKDLNPIHVSEAKHSEYVNNQSYIFSSCNFIRNEAPKPELNATLDTPAMPFSRGGGLAIYVDGNSSHNSFVIEHCIFSENSAQWGGGLQLEVQHRGQNNSFFISSSNFLQNKASFSGGGVRMGYLIWERDFLAPNNFQCLNCLFKGNSAMWGGGISIYGTTRPVKVSDQGTGSVHIHRKMVFTTCRWIKNTANVGSAIGAFLFNTNVDDVGPRAPYHVELNQCFVCGNKVNLLNHTVLLGQGAIYTVEVPLILKTKTVICNNSKTALVLDSATTEIHDEVIFKYNKGYRGGAVAIYGKSKLYFSAKSNLTFQGNYAHEKGGAIYVSFPGSPLVNFNATGRSGHACFFTYEDWRVDYDDWDTSIVFKDNSVGGLGRSIYATTLKNCRRTGETRENSTALEWKIIHFVNKFGNKTSTVKEEVRTDPIDIHVKSEDWNKPATEVFNATMTLLDEKYNEVFGMVHVDVSNVDDNTHVSLTTGSVYLAQNGNISSLQLEGNKGDIFNISVRTMGSQIVRRYIDNLRISKCPDGYLAKKGKCICAKNVIPGISYCDVKSGTVYMKEGFWAGRDDNGDFATQHCPPLYCNCIKSSSSDAGCLYKRGHMCKGNRNGSSIMCGACKDGYTVLVGSEECARCSNLSLLYFLLYAVVLFVLVMLVMLINLDVFTGYLNAWLYSYQVVSLLLSEGFTFDPFINFVIGLANAQIQLGEGTCLIDGLDDADKLVIMYILPTYILLVVFVLSKAVRSYPNWCFSKRVKAPFGAVCTIFVLCYTDITSISLKILNPARVGNKLVLYQNGAVEFFKGKHIAYGIIALLYILIFVIPFPLTLMFRPFITKKCQCLFNLNNLKPVYDSFQGVFKDEYRWCAAFYFVCRILLLLIFTYVPTGELKRALLEIACMLVLVVYVHLKPYKDEYNWINILDTVLLSNLSVIAILSTGIGWTVNNTTEKAFEIMVKILLYVPLAYVFVLLVIMARRYVVLTGGEDGSQTSLYETPASVDDDEP